MKLRDIFGKRAFAAATMAVGLSLGAGVLAASAQEQEPLQESTSAPPSARQEIRLDWSVDPLLPLGLIGGLGGLGLLIAGYGMARGSRGSLLRGGAALALSTALLNPEIHLENHEILPAEVAVVVDRSASQDIDGRAALTDRVLAQVLETLDRLGNVNVRVIDTSDFAVDGTAIDGTRLMEALEQGSADISPAQLGAVIVLTDGIVHDVGQMPALPSGVPMHVLLSGRDDEVDRRVVLEQAPAFGMTGDAVPIRFTVTESGASAGAGAAVPVNVFVDGEIIATRAVVPGAMTEVMLTLPHPGTNIVEIVAETREGELTDANNRVAASIEAIRETMRVLLISGAPNASERTWRDILTADPSLDLVHFTVLRPPSKIDPTPLGELSLISLPINEIFDEKIGEFDLIVFDGYRQQGIMSDYYYERMAEYVREGGAMLVIPGSSYATGLGIHSTPLGAILPAAPDGGFSESLFTPRLSETGQRHPVMRGLEPKPQEGGGDEARPWGSWAGQVTVGPETGSTVMTGIDDEPLLILNRVGDGRVALMTSSGAWMWDRGYEGGGPSREMLRRLTHWLLGEPALEEEALTLSRTEDGRIKIVQQTLGDAAAPVTLTAPSGEETNVTLAPSETPGLWQAEIEAGELGLYRAQQGTRSALLAVGTASPMEFEDTISTFERLRPLVEASGGQAQRMALTDGPLAVAPLDIRLQESGKSMGGEGWIGVKSSQASMLAGTARHAPLSGVAGALAFILLLGAMYARESGLSRRDLAEKLPRFGNAGKSPEPRP